MANERRNRSDSKARLGWFLCALASMAILIATASSWSTLRIAMGEFRRPTEQQMRRASAAIVFGGDDERVDVGLRLIAAHSIARLFISGPNDDTGSTLEDFVEKFSKRNADIVDLRQLADCCIDFGAWAKNTLQNALETRCWLRRSQVAGPLLLITSKSHMARALLALSASLPGREILPYPSDGDATSSGFGGQSGELRKFAGTLVVVHIPWLANRWQLEGAFKDGCPDQRAR